MRHDGANTVAAAAAAPSALIALVKKEKADRRRTIMPQGASTGKQSVTFDEPPRPSLTGPPAYGDGDGDGDDHDGALAVPANRLSESSRSDGSSNDHRVYGSTTTTTHTVHTTTTFFRLPRRKPKQAEPLFPINHLPKQGKSSFGGDSVTSRSSIPGLTPCDSNASNHGPPSRSDSQRTPTTSRPNSIHEHGVTTPPAMQSPNFAGLFGKSSSPATALFRPSSRASGQASPTRAQLMRGRSSTLSSLGINSARPSLDEHLAPQNTRTSSSIGRKSFGDLLGLSRTKQEPHTNGRVSLAPATPGSGNSKSNSLQLPRESQSVVLPERRDDDTPAKYLARLEEVVSRSVIAAAVSKGTDPFAQAVLRSYMRGFAFFGDPMDMAIRKLLMEAELPKETQQIDRTLQAFANRYHECNPGIYSTPDQAYFIAFSLLILHTDVFNKNNKHKMQKADYLKNTQHEGIFNEILEVFYDNITYTPFIHVEDDIDINGERIIAHKAKKKPALFPNGTPDAAKKALKEPIDPYTLIIDNRLDILRPNLKDVMHIEEHYNYQGTAEKLNLKELQSTFFKTGVLQIISLRSRPDAFMTEQTTANPQDAHPGVIDIKITKVGLLWRKDPKKKRTRSPWQEWGAILTGAQLYFFRNTAWIKNLMHQHETHVKQGHDGMPVIFKPPLDEFKPDALMSTDGAVALHDSMYTKHKHAFTYVRHGGVEEVLLADNDDEMNDWLAKLNYAAAFRTSGVRMRGVVGGGYDGQGRRAIRRLDNEGTAVQVQTPSGEVTITKSKIDHKMVHDILVARREIMAQKIADANEKLEQLDNQLELQLRNARHLQILAPIHPKTREGMLLSAARLAAQLKWSRVDMWKVKCHRDILLMDLEEERQLFGLSDEVQGAEAAASSSERLTASNANMDKTASPKSSRSPLTLALTRTSTITGRSDRGEDSPMTEEVFQTPPTSATSTTFHKHQNSWELPNLNFDGVGVDFRKGSVSSAISSNSALATPPQKVASSSSAPATEKPTIKDADGHDDVDADERDLLEQAGLIGSEAGKAAADGKASSSAIAEGEEGHPSHKHHHHLSSTDRNSKIRRSLQRTLREGAGHLSQHARGSRRGRDSSSAPGVTALSENAILDDAAAPDFLTRGSGSFVVHGKKASVITFGTELQGLTPDDRLRQQRTRAIQTQALAQFDGANGTSASSYGTVQVPAPENHNRDSSATPDYRAVLTAAAHRAANPEGAERRESAASASTATARSFRELHRKYSSAQQALAQHAARSASANSAGHATLTVPSSDTDSEVAVSFSDGTHTPLPPIEGNEGEHEDRRSDSDDDEDDDLPTATGDRRTQFFTPDPPASPADSAFSKRRERQETDLSKEHSEGGGERLPRSPPLQPVSA